MFTIDTDNHTIRIYRGRIPCSAFCSSPECGYRTAVLRALRYSCDALRAALSPPGSDVHWHVEVVE